MEEVKKILREQFSSRFSIREKRPGIFQLILPVYHEDGDMIEMFIEKFGENNYKISDYGMTIMRLSYSYELDSPNKETIFQKMLTENHLSEENGIIFYNTNSDSLYPSIMNFAQTISKICGMRYFKREIIESLFYEMLDEFIFSSLKKYNPSKNIYPITERDDLEADYQFMPNGHPVYLFGVKDTSKARLATISCLEYQRIDLKFKSFIVHEDFEKLPRKDRTRLTSACDKQFTSLDDFKSNAVKFFEKEI